MKRGARVRPAAVSAPASFNQLSALAAEETARRQAYLERLEYGTITDVQDPRFDGAFSLFASIFHTDGEPWVTRGRFGELFESNTDQHFQSQWGPVSHAMVYARDPWTGQVVGGAIHVAMVPPEAVCRESGVEAVYLGSYIFCAPEARGSGLALRMIREREKSVKAYAAGIYAARGTPCANPTLMGFNEQNDPLKMTMDEIQEDMANSGLAPWDRLTSSRRKAGWRWVDPRFHYVDPGRVDDAGSDHLRLGVKGEGRTPPPDRVPASLLIHFLGQCAAIRLGGASPETDPTYLDQRWQLEQLKTLRPVNDGPEMELLTPRFNALVAQVKAQQARLSANPGKVLKNLIPMDVPVGDLFREQDERKHAARRGRAGSSPGRAQGKSTGAPAF